MTELIILRDLPGIADIERVKATVGAEWLPENDNLQQRIDAVSVALFGITEADTIRRPITAMEAMGDAVIWHPELYADAVDASERECAAWEEQFAVLYNDDIPEEHWDSFFLVLGFDVSDDAGRQLNCLHSFSRQMIVVARGLMPQAVFNPLAQGRRTRQSVEEWAAALERDAKSFSPSRRQP